MGELLQGHGAVLVVVVGRQLLGDVGGGVAGLHHADGGVHRFVALFVEILLPGGQAAADLEGADKVDEVAAGADGVLVDDDQVPKADGLVGVPASVGAGVAAGGDDDVVHEV